MPVEQHSDPFEDHVAAALRQTGGAFDTDLTALAAAGRSRGRRLRLRRRAAVLGGATGVALAGVGGALLVPWGGQSDEHASVGSSSSPSAHASPSAVAPFSGDDMLRTLTGLLPEGKTSETDAKGTEGGTDSGNPYARLLFDDGQGKGAVSVSLSRVEPGSDDARQWVTCPDKVFIPYDKCTESRLPDGSLLMVLQGYEYPDRRVDTKRWTADLVTPTGQHVSVSEWNAAAEKDAPISRPRPPLSPAQLKKVAAAAEWRRAVDAIPEDPNRPTAGAEAPETVEVAGVLPTFVSLLPKNVDVVAKSGDSDDSEYAYVVVDDGKGRSLVQINVQPDMSDVRGDLFDSDSETLDDGTQVAKRQTGGDKGVAGAVMWTVDTMRTDGFRVVVSAFNAGTQHEAPTRGTPALTMKQLRAIALSPKWLALS